MTDTTQGASGASGDPAADAAGLINQILGGTVAQILIKNVLHGLMVRLQLGNQAYAVTFAAREGYL
jgi:hypothetical protein